MKNVVLFPQLKTAIAWLVGHGETIMQFAWNIVAALIILFIGRMLAKVLAKTFEKILLRRNVDATIVHFFAALVRYITMAFAIIAALGRVGIETSSIIAVIGAAGLAIGLALQGSLSNFAAGVLLVTLRPFRAGNFVQVGSVSGMVQSVHVFSTTLLTVDNKEVIIPNGKIIAGNIINFSREPVRRNEFIIGVAYDSDIDQVKKILTDIIQSEDRILKDREMTVRLNELGASSINFVVRVWSNSSDLQSVYWDVLERIKREFDANGISFPYPQMDVNFKRVKERAAE